MVHVNFFLMIAIYLAQNAYIVFLFAKEVKSSIKYLLFKYFLRKKSFDLTIDN